jgi:NADPH:quinone reductase-like Zn-dependent oxidoreductase
MNVKADMRAFAVRNFGEAPAIHDLPIPAEDGAFLIRVRYAGVNPIDYKLLEKLTATSTYLLVAARSSTSVGSETIAPFTMIARPSIPRSSPPPV